MPPSRDPAADIGPKFLAGGGEMGALLRAHDWAATSLGPPAGWPQPLRTAIRLILNTGHPMYVWWGPELLCFYNDAYRASIGPERHPGSLGRPGREVWGEIWDLIGPQIEQVMAGRGATWHENHLVPITRHGRREEVYWTYSYGPIDDDSAANGVGGVLVVCTETTAQVLAERRAKADLLRLDRMFRQAPAAIAVLRGPEHVFEMANAAYLALVGGRDVVGLPVAVALPEVVRQGFVDLLDRVFRTGEAFVGRAVPIALTNAPDGPVADHFLDFVYQPLTDDDGRVAGIFVQATDVTDAARAAAALRELNATLERRVAEALAGRRLMAEIVETTDAFVQALDTEYRFLAINEANAREYERIYGFRPRIGESLLDTMASAPESRRAAQAVWGRALAGEAFTEIGEFGDDAFGKRIYEMTFRPLRGSDGAIVGAYHISYDITERLRAQARLAEAEEQLRQALKMEAVGQLTGGMAHDFNNLLTIIRSSVDLLRRPNLDEQRRRRYVDAISETVDRASRLTGQLLAFARRQALEPTMLDVARQLRGLEEMLRTAVGARVRIALEIAVESCFVEADASQFDTAIVNMAINARDAMDGPGTLTIGVRAGPALAQGRERPGVAGRYVAVSLADTGAGIPADRLSQVFEPFYTTKQVGKGTGLGLSQVYGFAKQSGGDVTVESELGRGAVFTLYLPQAPTPDAAVAGLAARAEPVGRADGQRVLLVEDSREVGALAAELLGELGYHATLVPSAEQALALLAEGAGFDIVFTDVVMPGMSGIELGLALRRLHPTLPVVLTSGFSHALAEEGRHGFEVLKKPYDAEALARTLRRLAGGRQGAS